MRNKPPNNTKKRNFCLNRYTLKISKEVKIRSWYKITKDQMNKNENSSPPYMSIDEIINLLVEVRVDLTVLKKSVASKETKEQFKWAINGIDIVGCELAQNIAKKLKEK